MHDEFLTADKMGTGSETKQNLVKKTQWLREKPRQVCVSVCWSQQEQLQKDLNGGLEWWINGCWGLVTPPIRTSKQVNKLQCYKLSCIPLCFKSVIRRHHTLHFSISIWKRMRIDRGKVSPGETCVWFGDPIWQNVFCKLQNSSLFSLGKKKQQLKKH